MSLAVSLLTGLATVILGVGIVVLIEGLQDRVRGLKTWLREMLATRNDRAPDPQHSCKAEVR